MIRKNSPGVVLDGESQVVFASLAVTVWALFQAATLVELWMR